jgi:hypothetical protein
MDTDSGMTDLEVTRLLRHGSNYGGVHRDFRVEAIA